jgi:hypothetical protein
MSETQIKVCGKCDAEIDPIRRVDFTLKDGARVCRTGKQGDAMRPSSIYNRWTQFVETLRKEWACFGNGIILALAEEEMKFRRQELRKQITVHRQPD